MSETDTTVEAASATETAKAETVAAAPQLVKVHGKEFDVSTPEGRLQLQTWGEAVSTLVGKQGSELGSLRKFAAERKPTATEAELLAQARKRAEEGDVGGALETVFSYAKETESKYRRQQEIDRHNNETWDAYFESRPDLTQVFSRQTIRKISEAELPLTDEGVADPFAVLDQYWLTKLPKVAAPVEKPKTRDIPPQTLSGGAPASSPASKPAPKKPVSLSELYDLRAKS